MIITSHPWSMYILLGLLLTLQETTLQSHEETGSMDKVFKLNILENITVGEIVFVLNHSSWLHETYTLPSDVYFYIYEGNKHDRFAVDNLTGHISVAGYIDYDIEPRFRIKVRCQNCEHSYKININVEDVSSWPPVYNETCAMSSRSSSIRDSWKIPLRIYLDKEKTPFEKYIRPDQQASIVEGYMNNSECTIAVFFEFLDKYIKRLYNISELNVRFDGLDSIASFTLHTYEHKKDFPAEAVINPLWFDHPPQYHYSLAQVLFNGINTKPVETEGFCILSFKGQVIYSRQIEIEFVGCPINTFGFKCNHDCVCQNGASCHPFNGACKCLDGWYGPACDIPRPSIVVHPKQKHVNYGEYMSVQCKTYHISTFPNSTPAWSLNGNYINEMSFNNAFAIKDTSSVESYLGIKRGFDDIAGIYECKAVDIFEDIYTDTVNITIGCSPGTFGPACEYQCNCHNKGFSKCDRYTGCVCKYGWSGIQCETDILPPTIHHCPSNETFTQSARNSRVISWTPPTAIDNSGIVHMTSTYNPGDTFNVGITTVTYSAMDPWNNSATCDFDVEILSIHTSKEPLIIGICLTALLIAVPVCIYIGYRYRLKIHLTLLKYIEEVEIDENKEYDAFVAYSSLDEDFVADHLVKQLEEKYGYKLSIYQRDSVCGRAITHNISTALKTCRCVILLITKHFVESTWCKYEAKEAFSKTIDLQLRLIPIVMEDIASLRPLPNSLENIVQQIIYIEWPVSNAEKDVLQFWSDLDKALKKKMGSNKAAIMTKIMRQFTCFKMHQKYQLVPLEEDIELHTV